MVFAIIAPFASAVCMFGACYACFMLTVLCFTRKRKKKTCPKRVQCDQCKLNCGQTFKQQNPKIDSSSRLYSWNGN